MQGWRLWAGLAALALIGLAGCGDDEGSGPRGPDDATEIAALINGLEDAFLARDAEGVCAPLTDQGREQMAGPFAESLEGFDGESCEDVVEVGVFEMNTDEELNEVWGRPDYTAEEIDVETADDPRFKDSTDEFDPEMPVEVDCHHSEGNSYFAVPGGDGWKLALPFCTGR